MKLHLLAFAAHPDDVELACSGTLIKHLQKGYTCGIVDLTRGELGTRGNAEMRMAETVEADKVLGISVRENLDLGDGFFEHSNPNMLKVLSAIRKYRPDVVLANAPQDRHPDHSRAAKMVTEACFYSGLPKIDDGQEAWRPKAVYHYIQDRYLKPDFVVDISDQLELKMKALLCYKSQLYDPNSSEPTTPISTPEFLEFLKSRSRDLGRTIHVNFAEGFICERTPGVEDLMGLL